MSALPKHTFVPQDGTAVPAAHGRAAHGAAIDPPAGAGDSAPRPSSRARARATTALAARDTALVLLGTGVVGTALLRLLGTPAAAGLHLVGVANSRAQHANARGLVPSQAARLLESSSCARSDDALLAALAASGAADRVVV
ncbi:MAG TPA: hypothetical protein VFS55_12980, partial [Dokdonella sp.]|nr:hypothetical protein [Dokdonella sp.]